MHREGGTAGSPSPCLAVRGAIRPRYAWRSVAAGWNRRSNAWPTRAEDGIWHCTVLRWRLPAHERGSRYRRSIVRRDVQVHRTAEHGRYGSDGTRCVRHPCLVELAAFSGPASGPTLHTRAPPTCRPNAGERERPRTLLMLLPIVLGVAMASSGNASFSAAGMALALASNVSFSGRAVLTKALQRDQPAATVSSSDACLFYHVSRIGARGCRQTDPRSTPSPPDSAWEAPGTLAPCPTPSPPSNPTSPCATVSMLSPSHTLALHPH